MSGGIVIVGAGQAGGRAAETLRAEGYEGVLTLIGDEIERPYERPSLSKEMLLHGDRETIAWLHDPAFYTDKAIDLRLGVAVQQIDRAQALVHLSDGGTVPYDALLLATGARVRRLAVPGGEACNYLRSLEDSRALRDRLLPGLRVVVVGAGFIGLEVAAAAIAKGCDVTVVEVGDAPLGRVAPPELRAWYRALHEARGVRFRFGAQVEAIASGDGRHVVVTSDGGELAADLVVAGIGAVANEELAAAAGLRCDRGILVDAFGRTDDPLIYAAGDVARAHNPLIGRAVLLESWQNAQNQAIAIARNLARGGEPQPYAELPWFWSDQYEVNLQIYGLADEGAATIVRGDPAGRTWLLCQLRDGRIVFAAGINAARDLRAVRDLMKLGVAVDAGTLGDPAVSMMDLLRRMRAAAVE